MGQIVKIFCIEDDPVFSQALKLFLEKEGDYDVTCFKNGEEFFQNLHQNPDIVTVDYNLPGMSGLEIIQQIRNYNQDISVVVVSGQEDVRVAVEAYKSGAKYYVVKDTTVLPELSLCIQNLTSTINLRKEVEILREQIIDRHRYDTILGESAAILKVLKLIQKAEKSDILALITGESGTGKEVVARAMHYNSPRKKKPFVAVNAAAIPEDLIESELFGHEKGAFTGADSRRIGKFEEANGGTILLDEIGEMDINLQTKLLRVLQERKLSRVGSNKVIKLDIRVLAATNKNLAQRVKDGLFREDLYYRLQGFLIHLPPLRDRENDTIILAKHFLREICQQSKLSPKTFTRPALESILEHDWPGNIRELRSFVERAALMSDSDQIDVEDLIYSPSIA
ncbi:MAG: sigma-54 dependent transcriptional regulator [Bacteroidota bacterium]